MNGVRCYIEAVGLAGALGSGCEAVARALFAGDCSGMMLEDGWLPGGPARVGRVHADLPALTSRHAAVDCRTNRLLMLALREMRPALDAALGRVDPRRFGVVVGTSTAGIAEGEAAMAERVAHGRYPPGFHYSRQEMSSPAPFLAAELGVRGPAYVVSTACTSGAKAIAAACRLIRAGVCDAVLSGGADSLCKLTVNGFAALESTSLELCNPLSRNRRGINLGEGVALMLISRVPAEVEIFGCGESSDAYHISAPDPEGRGAEAAMRAALAQARLAPELVDYVNLHATATLQNDHMEARAVTRVFPQGVACSGTKPLTGHTLGAAGAIEAAFCWLALCDGRLPPHVWDGAADPELPALRTVRPGERFARTGARVCMSNSFAFGGSCASLMLGDAR